jgi:hypothetical protein
MGVINVPFSQGKLSFSKIQEILNNLINQDGGKSQNRQVLKEIGFINEYNYIISEKVSNEMIYYSKNHKILKNIIFTQAQRLNFLEWVKYLFDISNEELNSMQLFNTKIEGFKKRTLNKEFFQNNIKKYLFKNKYFNKLLNYGIPQNFRFFIWDIVLSERYNNQKYFNYDQQSKEYKSILQNNTNNPQIEKDVNRTFMKDAEQTPKNIQSLRNLLNCINRFNSSGYCQGMNYIVGYLLKLTNFDEIKTFYIFRSVLCDIKGYFEVGFPLLKKNNNLFDKLFKESYPKLYKHFQKHDIVNEFWVGKWFQTLFTLSLPFEELNVIWDVLLIRGFDFIVYICLALLEFIEKDLLEIKDSADIVNYFEKVLNFNEMGLSMANKQFFEDIDNYIIPLNEVLSEAYDLEKKNVGGNENRPYYDKRRRSDVHLTTFNFNNLNSDKKPSSNLNFLSAKETTNKISNSVNLNNPNINKNLNMSSSQKTNYLQNNNIIGNNVNLNLAFDNRKLPFYSTKNLGTYNFGDFSKDNKINNNSMGMNLMAGQQFQYSNNNLLNYYH